MNAKDSGKIGWEHGRKRLCKTCDFTYLLFMYLFILNYGVINVQSREQHRGY